MSESIQFDPPRDPGGAKTTSSSSIALKRPLLISLDLSDCIQTPSPIVSPPCSPTHSTLADHFPPPPNPTPKATVIPSFTRDNTTSTVSSARKKPVRRSTIVVDVDMDSPIPIFDDPESPSMEQSIHPKLPSVPGTPSGTPSVQQSSYPQLLHALSDTLPSSGIALGDAPRALLPSTVPSRLHTDTTPLDQEGPGIPFPTAPVTTSLKDAEVSSSFPSSGNSCGAEKRALTLQSEMYVDSNPPGRTFNQMVPSDEGPDCSNATTDGVASQRHRSATPHGRQGPFRTLSAALFLPSLDAVELPSFSSPSPVPRTGREEGSSTAHGTMNVDALPTNIVYTSNDVVQTSDSTEPQDRAITSPAAKHVSQPASIALFSPSLDAVELPSFSSPSPTPRSEDGMRDTRNITTSDDVSHGSDSAAPDLAISRATHHNGCAGTRSGSVHRASIKETEMNMDSGPPERTPYDLAAQTTSSGEADSPRDHPGIQSSQYTISRHPPVNPLADRGDVGTHVGRRARPPLVTIDIDECGPFSLFDNSDTDQEREQYCPMRRLQSPFNADDMTVFVSRENSNLEAEFNRRETAREGMGDADERISRLHWKARWERFPLNEITYRQTQTAAAKSLLQCTDDRNADEMNLVWFTNELLSQKFYVPV